MYSVADKNRLYVLLGYEDGCLEWPKQLRCGDEIKV
jgi:hypothetical protein